MKTSEEVLSLAIFSKVVDALEPFGLQGLDRLFCFMLVTEIQNTVKVIHRQLDKVRQIFN